MVIQQSCGIDEFITVILYVYAFFVLIIFIPVKSYAIYLLRRYWDEEFTRVRGRNVLFFDASNQLFESILVYPFFIIWTYIHSIDKEIYLREL